jgi:hypothetical protein
MKIGKILLFSLWVCDLNARIPDVSSRVYAPLGKVKDFSFDLRAKHISELVSLKVLNKELNEIKVSAYKYNDSRDIEVIGIKKVPADVKTKIRELFINKAQIVWGTNLADWLGSYKFVQEKNNWFTYVDDSGVLDTMEIKIKFRSQKLEVIEKRPTGTLKTSYFYVNKDWAGELLVLDSITRKTYEGNQSVQTENKIEYKKVDRIGWVPVVLKTKTTQQVNAGTTNKIIRNLDELIYFENFKINEGSAKAWFSSNK